METSNVPTMSSAGTVPGGKRQIVAERSALKVASDERRRPATHQERVRRSAAVKRSMCTCVNVRASWERAPEDMARRADA